MSIGETDKMWWDKIVRRVIENEHCYLLLVNYDNSFQRILPYTATYATKSMVAVHMAAIEKFMPELFK